MSISHGKSHGNLFKIDSLYFDKSVTVDIKKGYKL
jgi:hypothetical protein